MTLPDNVKALIDGYIERGEPVPLQYRAPEITPEGKPYLTAFWLLKNDRPIGFAGAGGISFTAIDRYADRAGITDPDEFWLLEAMIRVCDNVWLKHVNTAGADNPPTVADKPLSIREMFRGAKIT